MVAWLNRSFWLCIILLVGAVLALTSLGLLPLIVIAVVILLSTAARYFSLDYAFGLVVVAMGGILLFISLCSSFLAGGYFWSTYLALFLLSVASILLQLKAPRLRVSMSFATGWPAIASIAGPLFFVSGLAFAQLLPKASKMSWVMMNDAANNMLMGRDLINFGGVEIGAQGNPVPFTTVVLSTFMAGKDINYQSFGYLFHDILSLQIAWVFSVLVFSVCAALVAFRILRDLSIAKSWQFIATLLLSLTTMTWLVIGYPIDFGFLNAVIGLGVLFASLIIFLNLKQQPVLGLSGLVVTSTLALATWTPIVLFSGIFLLFGVWQYRGLVFRFSKLSILLYATFVFLLSFAVLITVPSFLRTGSLLASLGGVADFPKFFALLFPAALAILSVVIFGRRGFLFWCFTSLAVAQLIALGFLLFITRNLDNPWVYYPLKMLWFGSTFLILILIPLVFVLVSRAPRWSRGALAVLVFVGVLLFCNWSIPRPSTFQLKDPISKIIAGSYIEGNDSAVTSNIFERDKEIPTFYWQSANPQGGTINFWLLQNRANTLNPNVFELRYLAYAQFDPNDDLTVCEVAKQTGGKLSVVTARKNLPPAITKLCPQYQIDIEVTADPLR